MPTKESAKKRARQDVRKNARNRAAKSAMRTMIKATLNEARETSTVPEEQMKKTQSMIARLWKRGVIHKKKAARIQSRMTVSVAKLSKAQ